MLSLITKLICGHSCGDTNPTDLSATIRGRHYASHLPVVFGSSEATNDASRLTRDAKQTADLPADEPKFNIVYVAILDEPGTLNLKYLLIIL